MIVCRGFGLFAPTVNGFASPGAGRLGPQVFGIYRTDEP